MALSESIIGMALLNVQQPFAVCSLYKWLNTTFQIQYHISLNVKDGLI